ncbi:hypothetical protein CPB84DRAFT_1851602 [Gymnopilus junonius]|uniref:Uncharacterized protein n=1 Tax=Gymnopilus junonius TaxID=109634 RepID=A0A9P5NC70_GYMJU|nr:hypothetical protein CPB84DRAFT_1851602 [Gymnopilus junonius]
MNISYLNINVRKLGPRPQLLTPAPQPSPVRPQLLFEPHGPRRIFTACLLASSFKYSPMTTKHVPSASPDLPAALRLLSVTVGCLTPRPPQPKQHLHKRRRQKEKAD